jgi:hypothetical protein
MGYFKANAKYPATWDLLYQDMPLQFTQSKPNRTWPPRKDRHFCLGQMYYAHPGSGEHFYHCLLLTAVKGITGFELLPTQGHSHSHQRCNFFSTSVYRWRCQP